MYLDANDPAFNQSSIDCDIAIVGAGPAGITLAQAFKNTPFRVCLLESGGFKPNTKIQQLSNGSLNAPSPLVEKDYLSQHSQRLFGGTGSVWGGFCREMDEVDFEQRQLPVTHRWPISKKDLMPYYSWHALEKKYDRQEIPNSELEIRYFEKVIYPFNIIHKEEFKKDSNINVILNATVQDIILQQRNSVAHLNIINTLSANKGFQVKAKAYVLACGGVGNVKLLLNANSVQKNGIGNEHGNVGRYFMEHPHFQFYKPPALLWLADEAPSWLHLDKRYKPAFYFKDEKLRSEKLLNFCAMPSPAFSEKSGFAGSKQYQPNFSGLTDKKGAFHSMAFRIEQSPNSDSRITLSDDKDAHGLRTAHLDWKLSDYDKKSLLQSINLLAEELGKASLGRVRLLLDEQNLWQTMVGGGHLMGTTRMSEHPRQGVVDSQCKVHGMDNLFLAGSSVFSTAGVTNPTITLMALARRLASHLQDKLRDE